MQGRTFILLYSLPLKELIFSVIAAFCAHHPIIMHYYSTLIFALQ
jgi:hypothetical protein